MSSSPPFLSLQNALFLDFDGTLAPHQDDPKAVTIDPRQQSLLTDLVRTLGGAVAVVTGRDVRDISERVPRGLWRAGNHGFAIVEADAVPKDLPEAPNALTQAMEEAAGIADSYWIETKGPVLALHTRGEPARADEAATILGARMGTLDDYRLERGKDIIELKPIAANKGHAIERLLTHRPFAHRTPVFFGDDVTDEDGFAAVNAVDGVSVKVGDGETQARYRIAGPSSVWAWLERSLHGLS